MEEIKQKAREMFDERFKCIQGDCDGNGNIPEQVSEYEWTSHQCQFHAEYIVPINTFIDQIIDLAIAERDKEIVEMMNKLDTVDIKDQSGTKIREQLISKDSIIKLINNK